MQCKGFVRDMETSITGEGFVEMPFEVHRFLKIDRAVLGALP